jgi:hypothetical protein
VLFDFIEQRLRTVKETAAQALVDEVRAALRGLERQIQEWPNMPATECALSARPVADTLYHLLATGLLLAEGQILRDRSGDFRKLVMGALYVRKWLRTAASHASVFATRHLDWLDALADWTPLPADALLAIV